MLDEGLQTEIRSRLGADATVALMPIPSDTTVTDSTSKYIVSTKNGELVLIVSSEASPLLVKRGADRQRQFRAALPTIVARPIEAPIFEGFYGNKSYAVWVRRRPISSHGVQAKLEKALIAPRVYQWLSDLTVHTTLHTDPLRFIHNLRRLQSVSGLPEPIGLAASIAGVGFRSGEIPPVHVGQHGDLWLGNILRTPTRAGFTIIDWAGARLDGVPFFDLVRFALSVRASMSRLRREIFNHSRIVGCSPDHAVAYILSGLGALHRELEYFPESAFLILTRQKFDVLNNLSAT
jgi:hypothetical protein